MARARFIYDSPERNADLYYIADFYAPDPFIYFERRGRSCMVVSDLEFGRALREAKVDKVVALSPYIERARKRKRKYSDVDVVHEVLKDFGIRHIVAHRNSPFALVDGLRMRGYRVEAGPYPFCPERLVKDEVERRHILDVQRSVFAAMGLVRDVLAKSRIRGRRLVYRGSALSSDSLRNMINMFLMEQGIVASGTIVACGRRSIDPHDAGSGLLRPHKSIIVDIFPRSQKTRYYGDATRTFCRGRAPEALKKMYAAVRAAQKLSIDMIRAGVDGSWIYKAVVDCFEKKGYKTCGMNGRHQGFLHGVGHGIGLEVHEPLVSIGKKSYMLQKGNAVTVEPGLYYAGIGGARIEDIVYVTRRGCEVLGRFPRQLEIF